MGAAVGVGGTILATFGTSWFNLRQTRLQLAAQREEADRQRRFDSAKERRASRESAYAAFLGVGHTLEDLFEELPGWEYVRPIFADLHRQYTAVAVAGPGFVVDAAQRFVDAVTTTLFRSGREQPPNPDTSEIFHELRAFAEAAQRALADDGATEIEQR